MEHTTTRVFMNGNSQAVRIPAEFRIDTDQVRISGNEQGDLVLHPLRRGRGAALMEAVAELQEIDLDFGARLEEDRRNQPRLQERDPL